MVKYDISEKRMRQIEPWSKTNRSNITNWTSRTYDTNKPNRTNKTQIPNQKKPNNEVEQIDQIYRTELIGRISINKPNQTNRTQIPNQNQWNNKLKQINRKPQTEQTKVKWDKQIEQIRHTYHIKKSGTIN